MQSALNIEQATLDDYPIIQNMARFYVYDLSRECGFISEAWACPVDGLYESFDFKNYCVEPTKRAYLVKMGNELAGFVLLNQQGHFSETNWNMGEFFILAKFQHKGLGYLVAQQIWHQREGQWEVSVIPENKGALSFWRKVITSFTQGQFTETLETVDYDKTQPKRYIFSFNTSIQIDQHLDEPYHIAFVDKIDEETEKRMTADLIAYEASHGIDVNYRRFSITFSDHHNTIMGVLNAYTAFAEIYVDDIWVHSDYRHKGYGKQLLFALEEQFKGKGFNNINLCTSAFQAPEFYKKCGFIEEFTRINQVNPQLSKTFFVKFFDDQNQYQGLL